MKTLIMGLAGLAGKVTDSYPALEVKAGIIPDVCMCWRACGGGGGGRGCRNTQVALTESLITELD